MLALLHTLGGCGGTLVAQCLGNMPDSVLLSETNPRSTALFKHLLNPYIQLKQWYPSLFEEVRREFTAEALRDYAVFGAFMARLHEATSDAGLQLVVRDYNYVDYFGVPFVVEAPLNSSLLSAIGERIPY